MNANYLEFLDYVELYAIPEYKGQIILKTEVDGVDLGATINKGYAKLYFKYGAFTSCESTRQDPGDEFMNVLDKVLPKLWASKGYVKEMREDIRLRVRNGLSKEDFAKGIVQDQLTKKVYKLCRMELTRSILIFDTGKNPIVVLPKYANEIIHNGTIECTNETLLRRLAGHDYVSIKKVLPDCWMDMDAESLRNLVENELPSIQRQ